MVKNIVVLACYRHDLFILIFLYELIPVWRFVFDELSFWTLIVVSGKNYSVLGGLGLVLTMTCLTAHTK